MVVSSFSFSFILLSLSLIYNNKKNNQITAFPLSRSSSRHHRPGAAAISQSVAATSILSAGAREVVTPGNPRQQLHQIARGGGTTTTSLNMGDLTMFDNAPLWQSSAIIVGTNGLGLLLSIFTNSHYHVDLLGTGAFALSVLPQLIDPTSSVRTKLSATFVAIWSIKLAGFLFYRVIQNKHDGRLDGTLSTVSGAVGFWIVSALWGVLCALPHYLGATSSSEGNSLWLATGSVMYVIGCVMETMADYQKWKFKQTNPKQFCNVGLWSISQHPNWFGNLVLWAGIFVMNASAMIEPVVGDASLVTQLLSYKRVFFSLLSPLFMTWLFRGEADGTITNALELSKKRYGDDPNFKHYIENVPLIIPKLF